MQSGWGWQELEAERRVLAAGKGPATLYFLRPRAGMADDELDDGKAALGVSWRHSTGACQHPTHALAFVKEWRLVAVDQRPMSDIVGALEKGAPWWRAWPYGPAGPFFC
jgi:hypothetical protein